MIENVDYYIDKKTGFLVFTKEYHLKRGYCCGNGCLNCCYVPKHVKGNKNTKNELDDSLDINVRQGIH